MSSIDSVAFGHLVDLIDAQAGQILQIVVRVLARDVGHRDAPFAGTS